MIRNWLSEIHIRYKEHEDEVIVYTQSGNSLTFSKQQIEQADIHQSIKLFSEIMNDM